MYPGNNLLRKYIIISVVALAGLSLMMSACSTAGVLEKAGQVSSGHSGQFSQQQEKIPLETLAQVSDQELAQERGCYGGHGYDRYYFGMDIGINIRRGVPTRITSTFTAEVPQGSGAATYNQNTLTASFHSADNSVSYYAGVTGGTSTLGKGFAQVIAVAGQNNIVIANTNININIDSLAGLGSNYNALRTATGGLGMH